MGSPSKRESRKRKPTTLRNVSPFSKSISVPGGTSGATIFGSTTKLSMARYRQLAVRNDSECGVREFVLGRERDRFLQGQLGSFKFAAAKINYAKIRERIKIVRRLGQNFLIDFLRRPIFALIEILLGQPGKIDNVLGDVRLKDARNGVASLSGRRGGRFRRGQTAGWCLGRSGRRIRLRVFGKSEAGLDRDGIVIRNRNDRLAEQRQFIRGQPRHRLGQ